MSFNWQYYLDLAEYMMTNVNNFPEEEACYRAVVSRAYYASYCLARNYVRRTAGYEFDHHPLQQHFKFHKQRSLKKIGTELERLHTDRKKADYDDDLGESPYNKATRALLRARKIISWLPS